jgi:hypothetical protein
MLAGEQLGSRQEVAENRSASARLPYNAARLGSCRPHVDIEGVATERGTSRKLSKLKTYIPQRNERVALSRAAVGTHNTDTHRSTANWQGPGRIR